MGEPHSKIADSVLDLVGDTPLFEIRRLDTETPRGRAPDSLTGPGNDAHFVFEPARACRRGLKGINRLQIFSPYPAVPMTARSGPACWSAGATQGRGHYSTWSRALVRAHSSLHSPSSGGNMIISCAKFSRNTEGRISSPTTYPVYSRERHWSTIRPWRN